MRFAAAMCGLALAACTMCPGVAQYGEIASGTGTLTTIDGDHAASYFTWTSSTPTTLTDHSFELDFDDGSHLRCETDAWLAGQQSISMSELGCVLTTNEIDHPVMQGTATPTSKLDDSGNGIYELRFDMPATSFGDVALTLDAMVVRVKFDSEACGGSGGSWPFL